MLLSAAAGICIIGILGTLAYNYMATRNDHHLPPGPRGSCFSGVKSQLPKSEPWKTYERWSDRFQTPVISFRVYNRTIIVLNDVTSVCALLDQRANIYSERPVSWMYNVICGRAKSVFNTSANDPRHRIYRRILQTGLGRQAIIQSWQIMESEVKILLDGFMDAPGEWTHHIRRDAAGVIMKLAFGYTVKDLNDPFIKVAEETSKISGWATAPGRWMVDYYPILRFVPSFLPGAQWKRQGLIWRERLNNLSDVPHDWVKDQIVTGNYEESFTSRLLLPDDTLHTVSREDEDIIKWCAGGLYAGAADTTVSALISFVLLMALHPEVQAKAQRELDSVANQNPATGFIDTPEIAKLENLQYLSAIMKETLRYAPVANLALPHCLAQDDVYLGYRLPKGASVIANVWAIMHDPKLYPDPFTFLPERFTNPAEAENQVDPRQFAFGFGRRICPGIQFSETALLLNMASILSRFQISVPLSDRTGSWVPEFTTGITSHVKPFPITISPREVSALPTQA